MACDGVWDCLSSSEVSTWIREAIPTRKDNEPKHNLIEDIFDEIIAEDANNPESDGTGTDNMTCILVEF